MELDEKVKLGEEIAKKLFINKVEAGEWRRWIRYFASKQNLKEAVSLAEHMQNSPFIRAGVKESYVGINKVMQEYKTHLLNIPFNELFEVFGYSARYLTYLKEFKSKNEQKHKGGVSYHSR